MRVVTLVVLFLLAGTGRADDEGAEYVIDGTIKAIDLKAKEVTVKRGNGKETTVKLTDDTTLLKDTKPTTVDGLKVKQEVRVVYRLDSKRAVWIGAFVDMDMPPYRGKR